MGNVTTSMLIKGNNIFAPKLIPNVVDPNSGSDAKISCNMFKSESKYAADRKASFDLYIRSYLEPVVGGHYYARSFDSTTYQSASCTIPLSKCSMENGNGSRVGYISLGICTEGGSRYFDFDVGLGNKGNGWYPNVWGKGFLENVGPSGPNIIHRDDADVPVTIALGDPNVIIPGNATVTVLVEVGRTSAVDWMRATFSHSGKTGKVAINVPRGTLFKASSTANPSVRFNRFMSLVPASNHYADDFNDHSRLEGWMENLKLGSSKWTASDLQHVWDVQDENVPTIQISTLADSGGVSNRDHVVIYHTTLTH